MSEYGIQLQTGFVDRLVDNKPIQQRASDGYFNATAMCQESGKKVNDYLRLSTTKAFLKELSFDTGIPVTNLVMIFKGKPAHLQGTWVHPQVAINLAQWLSPKFAVLVSKWCWNDYRPD